MTPSAGDQHDDGRIDCRDRHRYISSPIHGETSTALTGDWGIPRANVDVTDDAPIYIPSFGHGELYG
jgi:hypothetical protein